MSDQSTKQLRKATRKMGLVKDQKGIINRYMRESKNWDSHLRHTRDFIIHSAREKNKKLAVILGSGWLLDVPLHELSEQFEKVELYDIRHPAQIKKKTEKLHNVELLEVDLTGGVIQQVYQVMKNIQKSNKRPLLSSIEVSPIRFQSPPDFIVSCNVLTQLGLLIKDYLINQHVTTSSEIVALEKRLQENHVQILKKGKSCIITETEEEIYDENDTLIGTNPLLQIRLPESKETKKWKWYFDTKMYYREDAKTYLNVTGMDI
jgi:hypothetical protein